MPACGIVIARLKSCFEWKNNLLKFIGMKMFNINTNDSRQFFANAWAMRYITQDPLQQRVIKIINAHPEYQHIVENLEQWKDHIEIFFTLASL